MVTGQSKVLSDVTSNRSTFSWLHELGITKEQLAQEWDTT